MNSDFATKVQWRQRTSRHLEWRESPCTISKNERYHIAFLSWRPNRTASANGPSRVQTRPSTPPRSLSNGIGSRIAVFKGAGDTPGWFDRWKLGSLNSRPVPRCIHRLADAPFKAYYQRRLMLGFALQMATITAGTSVLLFVSGLAEAVKTSFLAKSDSMIGLFVAMICTIPVLKLVFDIIHVRGLIFAIYTALIVLATTSVAILSEIDAPSVVIALGAITLETWIQWFLSGVQIGGHFLEWHTVFGIPAIFLPLATMGDDTAFSATVEILHSIIFGVYKAFSIALLLDTVESEEASLGVYFFTFDLLPGFFLLPLMAVRGFAALHLLRVFVLRVDLQRFLLLLLNRRLPLTCATSSVRSRPPRSSVRSPGLADC